MKKIYLAGLCCLVSVLGLVVLEQQRIDNVPSADDISTLSIEGNGETAETSDEFLISTILESIEEAKSTLRSSNNDQPAVDSYWTLEFQSTDGTTDTYYFYESRWFNYIEKPYEGIYTVDSPTLENLPHLVEVWGRGY
ncbi:MAG: DUF5301 domain-containing protein [Alkalibacterium sp.]|nr:DUF5301 domain-containing protein [Alkalibacterium sp.]